MNRENGRPSKRVRSLCLRSEDRPSGDFCLRPFRCSPKTLRPRGLCARPARTGRNTRRGTLGRSLPGPTATLAARRKRRSFPAPNVSGSVPGEKDGFDFRRGAKPGDNFPAAMGGVGFVGLQRWRDFKRLAGAARGGRGEDTNKRQEFCPTFGRGQDQRRPQVSGRLCTGISRRVNRSRKPVGRFR